MRNGLVTKIEKKFMLVKTDDNMIERIKPRPDIKPGQKIAFNKKDIYRGFSFISYKQLGASLSVLIMLMIFGSLGINQLNRDTIGIVSVDVNPSINISIDENMKISEIVTDDMDLTFLKGQTIETSLLQLFAQLENDGYLRENNPILIGYLNVKDDFDKELLKTLEDYKNDYTLVILPCDHAYYERAEKESKTMGRKYLEDLWTYAGETVVSSPDFVKETLLHFNLYQSQEDGFIHLTMDTKPSPSIIEKEDNKNANPIDENTEPQEETDTSESSDEEAVIEENEPTEDEIARKQAEIEAQEALTNQAYQDYLYYNRLYQEAKTGYNTVLEKEETALFKKDQFINKLEKLNQIESDFIEEQNNLNEIINNEMIPQIDQATLIKDEAIEEAYQLDEDIDTLKDRAHAIYASAYSDYQPIADSTLTYYEDKRQDYIDAQNAAGASADYSSQIAIVDENIANIKARQGHCTPLDDNFAGDYNKAYDSFDTRRNTSEDLYDQANDLKAEQNSLINEANKQFDQTYAALLKSYQTSLDRLDELKDLLDDAVTFRIKYQEGLALYSKEAEDLKPQVNDLYNTLQAKLKNRSTYYQIYLVEKEKLDVLTGEE